MLAAGLKRKVNKKAYLCLHNLRAMAEGSAPPSPLPGGKPREVMNKQQAMKNEQQANEERAASNR